MSFISISSLSEKLATQFETLRKVKWEGSDAVHNEIIEEAQYQVKGTDESVAVKVRMMHLRLPYGGDRLPPFFKVEVELSKDNKEVHAALTKFFAKTTYVNANWCNQTPRQAFQEHLVKIIVMKS